MRRRMASWINNDGGDYLAARGRAGAGTLTDRAARFRLLAAEDAVRAGGDVGRDVIQREDASIGLLLAAYPAVHVVRIREKHDIPRIGDRGHAVLAIVGVAGDATRGIRDRDQPLGGVVVIADGTAGRVGDLADSQPGHRADPREAQRAA